MNNGKIILAGGSGFLGRMLTAYFQDRGYEIVILSRQPGCDLPERVIEWDGRSLDVWARELENATALVNLAGRSVDCRYTERNRRDIMDSRVDSTRVLGEAVAGCATPPAVWLNLSTATIYKHTFGEAHDETTGVIGSSPEVRDAFSIEVAEAWEKAFADADCPSTRKLVLRSAMVFGREAGGVFDVLRRLTRFGLGGKMGHGRQWISWIHGDDFCEAVNWLIENSDASGDYNLCAPNPLTNAQMMATFRKAFGVPVGLPATRWMLELGAFFLRTETELVIKSRKVIPGRLLDGGFAFKFSAFADAIRDLTGRVEERPSSQVR